MTVDHSKGLTPDDVALLERVLGHEIEPDLVRTFGPSTLATLLNAARQEGAKSAPEGWRDDAVRYVLRYGGMCRGCADENGVCPTSGLPCSSSDARKAVAWVLDAVAYGTTHGYLDAPVPNKSNGGWVTVPREPTLEMVLADGVDVGERTIRKAWSAMISAAPSVPDAEGQV